MRGQHGAVVEVDEEIFGAPADRFDAASVEALGEAFGKREAEVGPPLLDRGEGRARHGLRQAAADGFDFGKFGHGAKAGLSRRR